MALATSQDITRSTAQSNGGVAGRPAVDRLTGVHDVHRYSPVERPVDRGKGTVDRLT